MGAVSISRADRALLRRLHKAFVHLAPAGGRIDQGMLQQMLGIQDAALAQRFFRAFDTDASGYVDEEEFLQALRTLMAGSTAEKLAFLFRVHDTRGRGYITRPEFTAMLETALAEHNLALSHGQLNDLAWTLFREADADRNGSISLEEFQQALGRHPATAGSLNLDVSGWLGLPRKRAHRQRVRGAPIWKRAWRRVENEGPLLVLVAAYLAGSGWLFADAFLRYRALGANLPIQIARGCGALLNLNGALILLFVMRNALTWMRGAWLGRLVPVDAHIDAHRWIGQLLFAFALVHTGAHLTNYHLSGRPVQYYLLHTPAGLSGVLLLAVFAVMWLLAQNFVRRSGYFELFSASHALYVAWFGLLLWHGPVFWKWAALPAGAYLLERWFRRRRRKYRTEIVETHSYVSGVTQLVMKRPEGFAYRPADFAFVRLPDVARFEWHPFTLSSSPDEPDTVSVHVRSLGNWSRAVYRRFARREPGRRYGAVPVYLDGPYGTPSNRIFRSTHAILIGAGIGATPFASILQTIQLRNRRGDAMSLERVHFFWLNRGQHAFEWFTEVLARIEAQRANELIDINIYMTDVKPDLRSSGLDLAMELLANNKARDVVTGLRARTHLGHPDWPALFGEYARRYRRAAVDVYFCGPPGLARKLKPLCRQAGFRFRREHF